MVSNISPTAGLGGGLEVGKFNSPYFSNKHTEKNTIYNAFGGDAHRLYLGMMQNWFQFHEEPLPLLNATEYSKQILEVPMAGTTLDYDIPYKVDPIKIRANIVDATVGRIGQGQTKFPFVTDEQLSPGDLVMLRTLRSGVQIRISTEVDDVIEPYSEGDGFVHQAYVAGDIDAYIPREFLTPGTFVFPMGNPGGERTDNRGSIDRVRRGVTRYTMKTGSAEIGIEHQVTSYGDIAGTNVETISKGFNFNANYNYSTLSPADPDGITNYLKLGPNGKPITGSREWVPGIIDKMGSDLLLHKERMMTWSDGYSYTARGDQRVDVPTGYYPQIKRRGNFFEYYDTADVYDVMKEMAFQLRIGNRKDPFNNRITFSMGIGAYIEAQKAFKEYALNNQQFLIIEDGKNPITKGIWTGDSQTGLGFNPLRVIEVRTPELGTIRIEHNAALDWLDGDNAQQSFHGQYPESSYIIWIEDITSDKYSNYIPNGAMQNVNKGWDGTANVVMIKPKNYQDTIKFIAGSGCNPTLERFLGKTNSIATREKGFTVLMDTWAEVLVKDASRIAVAEFKPKNRIY